VAGPCQGRTPPEGRGRNQPLQGLTARPTLGAASSCAQKSPRKISRGLQKKLLQKGGESGAAARSPFKRSGGDRDRRSADGGPILLVSSEGAYRP
jgi:hypothetical protein